MYIKTFMVWYNPNIYSGTYIFFTNKGDYFTVTNTPNSQQANYEIPYIHRYVIF